MADSEGFSVTEHRSETEMARRAAFRAEVGRVKTCRTENLISWVAAFGLELPYSYAYHRALDM